MADKTLFTRIINKNDSLANWTSNDPVLKQGEIALAYIETTTAGGNIVPTYLMKVGHNGKKFSELKWLAAPASDVHGWAKAETAVQGIPEIANIATNAGNITKLQADVKALQGLVGGNVGDTIANAIAELDVTDTAVTGEFVTAVSEADGKITVTRAALKASDIPTLTTAKISDFTTAVQDMISEAIATEATNRNKAIATAKQEAITAAGTDATTKADKALSDAKTYADGKASTAENNAKAYADSLASNYDKAGAAAEAQANAKGYTDSQITAEITRANGAYDAKGAADDALETAKAYADELKDSILGEGISETFDTLKEIQNWIEGDGVNATELTQAIATETSAREAADAEINRKITALEAVDHDHSNKTELDLIASGDKAKWDTAAGKAHEHSNKTVLDGITAGKVEAWDAAEQNAKNYSDGQFSSKIASYSTTAQMNTAISAAETRAATDAETKANTAKSTVIGTTGDASTANTVYGAKKYADEKAAEAQSAAEATAAANLSSARTAISKEIDDDVKVVADRITNLTTDNIAAGTEVWIFDCGTSSTVI